MAFVALPLAFAYHLTNNLNHLIREGMNQVAIISNPFGINALPLTMMVKHLRYMDMFIPQYLLYAMQTGLMVLGFWIGLKIIQHRGNTLLQISNWCLAAMIGFVIVITTFHMWLLSQLMVIRM